MTGDGEIPMYSSAHDNAPKMVTVNVTYPKKSHARIIKVSALARRASEKVYDVAKVDERVNRAVAAANRAANAARLAVVKAVQKQILYNGNNDNIPTPFMRDW
ncbi:unnamed protein product [Camellia sinensis]